MLNQYLYDTERQAKRQIRLTLFRLVEERNITEELKAHDPLCRVQEMNNPKQCAEDIVLKVISDH